MRPISLETLSESEHPVAQPDLLDDVLNRYQEAIRKPGAERTHDDWAVVVAVHEAAPDYATPEDLTNYYSGKDEQVAQLRSPVQGGNVNQP